MVFIVLILIAIHPTAKAYGLSAYGKFDKESTKRLYENFTVGWNRTFFDSL